MGEFEVLGDGLTKSIERKYAQARGEIRSFALPWPMLDDAVGCGLRQGHVSVLAGPGGNGKTNLALNLLVSAVRQKIGALYMPLEDNHEDIMERLSAIVNRKWKHLFEAKTMADAEQYERDIHADKNRAIMLGRLDEFYVMKNPKTAHKQDSGGYFIPSITPALVIDWLLGPMCKGKELIIIDPVSMFDFGHNGEPDWKEQERFVQTLHSIAKEIGAHIMLLAHIRKRRVNNKGECAPLIVDDIQGAAAFNRHTRYVFLLDYHPDGVESMAKDCSGVPRLTSHKRTMLVAKANFGSGSGRRFAFDYQCEGPIFREHGLIVKAN
jgi:hypothetical protein